jgi:phosphomannomutase
MPRPLKCVVSVSGIRGIVGETITADQVLGLAAAFGHTIAEGGTVVVGRDSRPTGEFLVQAVSAGLRAAGCDVVDIGIVPTPTVPIMVAELRAAGGIMVSSSHNPVEWNALKFFNRSGRNVDQAQLNTIVETYELGPTDQWQTWNDCGGYHKAEHAIDVHLNRVMNAVSVDRIRNARFTVVIDSVNGSGSRIAPELLARLGCRVIPIYTREDQVFPRDPEPTADNVRETGAVVKAVGADLGFVQDPDADRLAIIDNTGRYIGEEYTLVLCAAARIAAAIASGANARDVVACTNLSTSRMLEDVAAKHGATVVRTKVGEANVVDAMEQFSAVVGGEGNGGVIDPRVVRGRDSQIAMALVLEHLATVGGTLSDLVDAIPRYYIHKEKVAMDRVAVKAAIPLLGTHSIAVGSEVDTRDGIKLVWPDRWAHLRASGTEPVSRIITEAPTADEANNLADLVRNVVGAELVKGH